MRRREAHAPAESWPKLRVSPHGDGPIDLQTLIFNRDALLLVAPDDEAVVVLGVPVVVTDCTTP
ncbi:hypothetical protein [Caulobacter sp. S45]|jgi:hypothetical protein|uniref:hypothetical protein n=1 Tax=Caulobacter sp. S45 TaxID=1641861 RepID=UPI00131C75D4|nr:hypothetical protein [Caulobacter sp. S45]